MFPPDTGSLDVSYLAPLEEKKKKSIITRNIRSKTEPWLPLLASTNITSQTQILHFVFLNRK